MRRHLGIASSAFVTTMLAREGLVLAEDELTHWQIMRGNHDHGPPPVAPPELVAERLSRAERRRRLRAERKKHP